MVSVNVPAVIDCDENVCTLICLSLCELLYSTQASNAPDDVSAAHVKLALGVKMPVVPLVLGAVSSSP
ncbi:MAG: hypothetical protein IPM06_17145 [Rhizobiales bacterium]|nr:hypothetical protein [Hyphomicrobiales bacterium]